MAGIYFHIPFCKTRCIYCDFYSTTNGELKERLCTTYDYTNESNYSTTCTLQRTGNAP